MRATDEQTVINQIIQRLAATKPQLAAHEVAQVVEEAYALFHGCRIREFVPLFVERRARVGLEQLHRTTADTPVETATPAML